MATIALLFRWIHRLRWPLLAAALLALGIALHICLPPLPRWSFPDGGLVAYFGEELAKVSPDGKTVHYFAAKTRSPFRAGSDSDAK